MRSYEKRTQEVINVKQIKLKAEKQGEMIDITIEGTSYVMLLQIKTALLNLAMQEKWDLWTEIVNDKQK